MKIGIVGLGKMGLNLALNIQDNGYDVVGYDVVDVMREAATKSGIHTVKSLETLVEDRNVFLVMVPSGQPTEDALSRLNELLKNKDGSIVIDGGNTNYKRSIVHFDMFKENGIRFLDVGTSGGVSGARYGACLMIGGDAEAYDYLKEFFEKITVENGHLYTGKPGSGHYLKMVHNGVEYGMMQAIGEGFELLGASEFDYDFRDVSKVWNHGSVVRSWLMELAYDAFVEDPNLDAITGEVDASGEGEWTVASALEHKVPIPVITASVFARYRSKQKDTYTGKVVSALRSGFGGHAVYKK